MLNITKISSTLQGAHQIKKNLEEQIHDITTHPEIYAQSPFNFSSNRKLSFERTLKIILSFGGQSLSSELLSHFNFSLKTPTASPLVQARSKIKLNAFEQLFYRTIPSGQPSQLYKGYRIFAHDGSDLNIPYDEKVVSQSVTNKLKSQKALEQVSKAILESDKT